MLPGHGERRLAAAALDRDAAARMEAATGRNIGGIGHGIAEADVRHAAAGLRRQHARQQRLRVGMARITEQRVGLVPLHDAAEIHHGHLARDMLDHREVVADEDVGQPEIAPQVGEQIEDLRLHRHIERAGRLVADHDARFEHQRARDRGALALPAGKLRRHALAHPGRKPDAFENLGDPALDLGARECALGHQWKCDDVLDALARIERGERILEYRLDQPGARLAVEREQPLALDQRAPRGWREQPEDEARERRFSAAGLADDAEYAACRHAEGNVVDRDHVLLLCHQAGTHAEFAPQVFHLDRGAHAGCGSASSCGASRHR